MSTDLHDLRNIQEPIFKFNFIRRKLSAVVSEQYGTNLLLLIFLKIKACSTYKHYAHVYTNVIHNLAW